MNLCASHMIAGCRAVRRRRARVRYSQCTKLQPRHEDDDSCSNPVPSTDKMIKLGADAILHRHWIPIPKHLSRSSITIDGD